MSVTNAISGIIVVGALLQIGEQHDTGDPRSLAFVAILLASHQHLRRLRRDPPHARHVLEGLTRLTVRRSRRRRPRTSSRRCCSSSRLAGLSKHETARRASSSASPAWPSRSSRPSALAAEHAEAVAIVLLVVAVVIGARDRAVAGAGRRDDRHARADRAAAQLRRPRRRAGRLERLPRGRAQRPRRPRSPASLLRHPPRRGLHRRLHRRGHLHRLDRRVPQAVGADQVRAADAAGQELPQPRRAGRVRRC